MNVTLMDARLLELRALIEDERNRVALDMTDYPTPVPACDVDFNALIDERIRLSDALVRLDGLRAALFDRTPMAARWNHHPHGPGVIDHEVEHAA